MDVRSGILFKTFMIFLIWVTKGLYMELMGPSMIDLKLLFNTNYESLTRAVAGRGSGGFLGALLGGLLADKYDTHLDIIIAVATCLSATAITLVPFVPSVNYVWLMYFCIGCSGGILNIAGTRVALEIWKEKSSTVLQLLHTGFGIGALVAPLICSPFLAEIETLPSTADDQAIHYKVLKKSRVHVAYIAIGIFTYCVSIPFYIFRLNNSNRSDNQDSEKQMLLSTTNRRSFKDMINPATYAKGNFSYGLFMFAVLSLYYFNLLGAEKVFVSFVRTFSVDVFNFGKAEASYLNTAFWCSLVIGRIIGSVVAHFVPVRTMLISQTFLHLISVTCLNMFASQSSHLLWLLTIVEGFVVAPLYGLGVVYGNTQIDVTGVCLTVIVFAGSFGDLTFLWTAGRMYDNYGPQSILHMATVGAWLLIFSVILFRMGERQFGEKSVKSNMVSNSCQKVKRFFKLS